MIHIEHITFNAFQTQCYIAYDEDGKCAIIDPGCHTEQELEKIQGIIRSKDLKPECILLTHCHFDHIYGMADIAREYKLPVYLDKKELFSIDVANPRICQAFGLPLPESYPLNDCIPAEEGGCIFISEGDIIKVGSMNFHVIETAGHSAGGICYLEKEDKALFSGDTLFAGSIGRTDHPGGDYDMLIGNIMNKLMTLDGDVKVYPGHGPASDIATERMTNPFLQPFNEPYEDL